MINEDETFESSRDHQRLGRSRLQKIGDQYEKNFNPSRDSCKR